MVVCQTYQLGDREYLEAREGDLLGGDEFDEESGPTWTLLVDDIPATIFGFVNTSPGVYELWAEASDTVRGHGFAVIRLVNQIIELAFKNLEMHRLQATCRADREEYTRFMEIMGFEREGVLRQVTPNRKDLILYSMVRD